MERKIDSETSSGSAYDHHQAGIALAGAGRFTEALASYRSALALRPDYAEAHNNLGNALHSLGRHAEALAHYRRTLELLPLVALVHNNLGKALAELGEQAEAERCFLRALELQPDYAVAHNDLATLYQRGARLSEAEQHYRRALQLGYLPARGNLANTLKELGHRDEAEREYRLAMRTQPESTSVLVDLGLLLRDKGAIDEAQACFRRALQLDPDCVAARWAAAMSHLPVVPTSQAAAEQGRAEFAAQIAELENWFGQRGSRDAWQVVGVPHPFYLAYYEANNCELLSRHGRLCAQLMRGCIEEKAPSPSQPRSAGRIRIGIASAHLRDHSVWRLIKGWVKHLARSKFELYLFSLDPRQDQETHSAISLSAHFDSGERGVPRWASAIRDANLDILFYPEIGMHPGTVKLASLRLAPAQVAWGGHPETTGLPTIDYFLSAEALEPEDAQANYSENLVLLPGLGCCYEPPPVPNLALNFDEMGIDAQRPLLICPGMPFKYPPMHDWVLAEIARRVGRCQMIFFRDTDGLWRLLKSRLEQSFASSGVKLADHVNFVPWQPVAGFHCLMRHASVFLDTIGFSGFNTAIQAVECALPIVSREGRFMRGRLASGILRRLGLHELVAATEEEYVDRVVRLATDAGFRDSMRSRIVASRAALFGDVGTVRALEDFFQRAAGAR